MVRTFHQGWRRSLGGTKGEGLDHGIDQPIAGGTSSEKQTYSRFQESSSVESRDRTLQSTVEQIHDDPVPEMVEQLVKLPKTVSQDEIQTVQTMEVPLLQFINKVIAALERGMTGGSFLQDSVGAALQRADMNSEKVSGSDSSSIPSFFSGGTSDGGRYGPQSGEIVGILKQLMDETSVDLQTLKKKELDQKTNHRSVVTAKTRETLSVEVEMMESKLFEAERAPFVKVKGLITRLINRLQTEISHVSYCDEETSIAAEKEEDLEADIAKHSSTLETAAFRSTKADPESTKEGHPDKICDQIPDVVIDACLTCDAKCKVACETCVKDNMFMVAGEITVAEKMDHKTVVRGVMPNIEFDSFIDDLSSVGGKGLKHELEVDTMCADERDIRWGRILSSLKQLFHGSACLNGDISQQVPKQQQHKHNNFHNKQRQQAGQTEEERERRKGERGEEEERDAEEEAREQVENDVTDWTVVTRNKREKRRTIQIFFKVNESRTFRPDVSPDDEVDDVIKQIQSEEDVYVTLHGRVLKRSEKLKSCEVTDGCMIQVTSRMRGGGKHKDKKSKAEKKQAASGKKLEQKFVEEVRSDKVPAISGMR